MIETAVKAVGAMAGGAIRDRLRGVLAIAVAGGLVVTAWMLGLAGIVVLLSEKLGWAGSLLSVAAGLLVIAGLLIAVSTAQNRAGLRAREATRAAWRATSVAAVEGLLQGGSGAGQPTWVRRTTILLSGIAAMVALALVLPAAEKPTDAGDADGSGDA